MFIVPTRKEIDISHKWDAERMKRNSLFLFNSIVVSSRCFRIYKSKRAHQQIKESMGSGSEGYPISDVYYKKTKISGMPHMKGK
jgi:hypothetical protein